MSPQTVCALTTLRARALSVTFPVAWTNTERDKLTGVLATKSTVQLGVGETTSGGSTSSTTVPGASTMLTTVMVSGAHSFRPGGCESERSTVIGVLGGVACALVAHASTRRTAIAQTPKID